MDLSTRDDTPFHAGERLLQDRLGLGERMAAVGRTVIREHMPEQHREFFEQLPTLLLAALDEEGRPWATLLAGLPGFLQAPDARTLRVSTLPGADDPVRAALRPGAAVGLLGLQPHTRRRNRMNGRIGALTAEGFDIQVLQSFGNCPKYIQAREPRWQPDHRPATPRIETAWLGEAARALICRADTLFIASASGARIGHGRAEGVDVSHRGGPPGFVELIDGPAGTELRLPDYPGNRMFNTLGNLQQWPQAGLLFVDHSGGGLLQLAVETRLVEAPVAPAGPGHPAIERWLHARVTHGQWRPWALPLTWTAPQPAPQFDGENSPG